MIKPSKAISKLDKLYIPSSPIRSMGLSDYLKYYNLERYLFEEVTKKFKEEGQLGAFDFFCIVMWKANRAKKPTE